MKEIEKFYQCSACGGTFKLGDEKVAEEEVKEIWGEIPPEEREKIRQEIKKLGELYAETIIIL